MPCPPCGKTMCNCLPEDPGYLAKAVGKELSLLSESETTGLSTIDLIPDIGDLARPSDFVVEKREIPGVGDLATLSECELWTRFESTQAEIKRLEQEIMRTEQYLTAARYRRGLLLLELKRRSGHGQFEPLCKQHKIESQRASEDMRIARHFPCEEEAGKFPVVQALKMIKKSGTVCGPYENCYACPAWVRDVITRDFGFPGLDVSASHGMEFGERFYSPPGDPSGFKQDGLQQDWKTDCQGKVIWCNPPYHKEVITDWVKKAWTEAQRGCVVVCMLPLWRSHGWFSEYVKAYAEVRISGAPIILQGFGPQKGTRCGNVDSPFAYDTIIAIFRKKQQGFINAHYMEPLRAKGKKTGA